MTSVFLLPGEAKFVRRRTRLSTLFGSCVGVCLHDTRNKWGGLNHYMLPFQEDGALEAGKYGDFAVNALIRVACSAGSLKGDLVASIVGGGNVTGHLGSMASAGTLDIGRRNIEVARKILKEQQIRVIREEVGGTNGRKIYMDTATNEIEVRTVAQSEDTRARAQRTQEFRRRKARVLIVDDSATVRRILRKGIELSDDMEVVGEAENPFEAREMLLELNPDVLCLDIIMPRLDGHSFLKKLMRFKPIPTVIVSTIAKRGSEMRRKVMAAGAVGVIDKEELELYKGIDVLKAKLLPELRRAAHATVAKR